jgi:hypothetical protein
MTPDREVEIQLENGNVTSLKVNGEKINPSEYDAFTDEIAEARQEIADAPAAPSPSGDDIMVPAPPAPGLPGAVPMPPAPPCTKWIPAPFGSDRSRTTTIIREKNGDGYSYRIESMGDETNVLIMSDSCIAIVNGEKIDLDADSIFVIEKREGPIGMFSRRPLIIDNGKISFWGDEAPDLNFDFDFEFAEPQMDLRDIPEWEGLKILPEHFSKAMEEYAKQFPDQGLEYFDEEKAIEWEENLKKYLDENTNLFEGEKRYLDEHQMEQLLEGNRSAKERQLDARERLNRLWIRGQDEDATSHLRFVQPDDALFFQLQNRDPFWPITEAMDRDGLINTNGQYSIVLDENKLKVNGKRMIPEMHQKYLELFEKTQGYPINGKTKIEISN